MTTPRILVLALLLAPSLVLAAPPGSAPPPAQIPIVQTPAVVPQAPVAPAVGESPSPAAAPVYVPSPACEVAMADLSKAASDLPQAQARLESAKQERRVPGTNPEADIKSAREALAIAQTEQDKAKDEMTAGHCH